MAGVRKALRLLNERRTEELAAALFHELARLLGPNYSGERDLQALLILPANPLEALASAWPDEFLDDVENELNEYWGLFHMLQAQDEDLRGVSRDWLLELEDGVRPGITDSYGKRDPAPPHRAAWSCRSMQGRPKRRHGQRERQAAPARGTNDGRNTPMLRTVKGPHCPDA